MKNRKEEILHNKEQSSVQGKEQSTQQSIQQSTEQSTQQSSTQQSAQQSAQQSTQQPSVSNDTYVYGVGIPAVLALGVCVFFAYNTFPKKLVNEKQDQLPKRRPMLQILYNK